MKNIFVKKNHVLKSNFFDKCNRGIVPVIGIGYKFRDYRNEGFSNYSGYYV